MSDLRRALALIASKQHAATLPHSPSRSATKRAEAGRALIRGDGRVLDNIDHYYFALYDWLAASDYYRRAATISDYGFEGRSVASLYAARAFGCLHNSTELEMQLTLALSMLETESASGITAHAVLKRHRADALAISAQNLRESGRYSEALLLLEGNLIYYESIDDAQNLTRLLH